MHLYVYVNFRLWAFLYFRSYGNRLPHSLWVFITAARRFWSHHWRFYSFYRILSRPSVAFSFLTQSLPLGEHHRHVSLVLFIPPLMEPIRIMPSRIKYLFNIDIGVRYPLIEWRYGWCPRCLRIDCTVFFVAVKTVEALYVHSAI